MASQGPRLGDKLNDVDMTALTPHQVGVLSGHRESVVTIGRLRAHRVLVVEDDAKLRSVIARGLREQDIEVVSVADGASALAVASRPGQEFDVIVMDIGLPDSDGRDVCHALRARGDTAMVLFLTAKGQVGDLLEGFAAGGDDYLSKPFEFEELRARLNALTRRSRRASPTPPHQDAHLDPGLHAIVGGDTTIGLTPTEYRILATLMSASGQVVRRRELLAAAWPTQVIVNDNTLDQYVARLRRKLAELPNAPRLVTAHGVGYRFLIDGQ